ncbi:MAG TPA: 4Fe-4S dicluster domain-containing protein [Streptosporangiaceae bacterium]|nr:4Fe-4S dicluster domain-containing protein [Streptosporangiaceae bacterium]
MATPADHRGRYQLTAAGLEDLHQALTSAGYRVIGPRVTADAIVLGELKSASELPFGWGVSLSPGGYRLRKRHDSAAFGHSAGPGSWKQFLHPPREQLWSASRTANGFVLDHDATPERPDKMAFLGVRPCDLRAIQIQDRVLGAGGGHRSAYARRRAAVFIVVVNCTEPGELCFCTSMGTGPESGPGFDLLLTELADGAGHSFIIEAGSEDGCQILEQLPVHPADPGLAEHADAAVAGAADRMGRFMDTGDIRELLAASHHAQRWEDVASRCLTCGNCTMACPTCFCTTAEDVTDFSGEHAERWQSWSSCFELDFSYLHGGPVRSSGVSRYRQWLTHKLGTWHDQFGSSGCVGCGRCIVWCPVGIDLTEEIAALRAERDASIPAAIAGPDAGSPETG